MTLPRVKISLTDPGRGTVHVDGHRLAGVVTMRLDVERGSLPTLALTLRTLPAEVAAGRARIALDPESVAALQAAGWTPPEGM